jgi:hypothetical protein
MGLRPILHRTIVTAASIVVGCAVSSCADSGRPARTIAGEGWDTILTIGSMSVDDTVLISPAAVVLWHGNLAILEDQPQRVRLFSASGADEWTFGSPGQGPGEMLQAYKLVVLANGNLGVADGRNRKLVEIDSSGRFVRERYYRDLPGASDSPTPFGNRFVWSQYMPGRPLFVTDREDFSVLDSLVIPWPEPVDQKYRPDLSTWTAGSADRWVAALWFGPYFAVGDDDGVSVFPMVEPFHWAYAPSAQVQQDPLADSAYVGARDVALVGDEVFILGGGRPRRRSHVEEPTRLIDVYSVAGEYKRTYELPFPSWAFDTADGRLFYLLTEKDGVYPLLFGLRVR